MTLKRMMEAWTVMTMLHFLTGPMMIRDCGLGQLTLLKGTIMKLWLRFQTDWRVSLRREPEKSRRILTWQRGSVYEN